MIPPTEPFIVDGADRSCVRLLLELRDKMAALPAGTVVHLYATDPAAPLDLAAWCHLTGHDYLGPLPRIREVPGYALQIAGESRPTDPASPWRLTP